MALIYPDGTNGKESPASAGDTRIQSLGWEDPLEEIMATHSGIFALESPMDRGAWRATVHGFTWSATTEATQHTHLG